MKTLAISFFLLCPAAFGQLFSFGVRGGVPLTSAYSTTTYPDGTRYYSASNEYLIGPMVELRLPFGLGVEADALYRPLNLSQQIQTNTVNVNYTGAFNSWEFPILAKYHFLPLPIVKPYVDAGPTFRTASGDQSTYLSTAGFAIGAGVDVKLLWLHVEPEFRYVHWGSDKTLSGPISQTGPPTAVTPSNQNQVEFLVGLAF